MFNVLLINHFLPQISLSRVLSLSALKSFFPKINHTHIQRTLAASPCSVSHRPTPSSISISLETTHTTDASPAPPPSAIRRPQRASTAASTPLSRLHPLSLRPTIFFNTPTKIRQHQPPATANTSKPIHPPRELPNFSSSRSRARHHCTNRTPPNPPPKIPISCTKLGLSPPPFCCFKSDEQWRKNERWRRALPWLRNNGGEWGRQRRRERGREMEQRRRQHQFPASNTSSVASSRWRELRLRARSQIHRMSPLRQPSPAR